MKAFTGKFCEGSSLEKGLKRKNLDKENMRGEYAQASMSAFMTQESKCEV